VVLHHGRWRRLACSSHPLQENAGGFPAVTIRVDKPFARAISSIDATAIVDASPVGARGVSNPPIRSTAPNTWVQAAAAASGTEMRNTSANPGRCTSLCATWNQKGQPMNTRNANKATSARPDVEARVNRI
jgi:hypothetical protein